MNEYIREFHNRISTMHPTWGRHYPDRREFKWLDGYDGEPKVPAYHIINGNMGLAFTVPSPTILTEDTWSQTMRICAVVAANDAKYHMIDVWNDIFSSNVNVDDECNPYHTHSYIKAGQYALPKDSEAMMDMLRDVYVQAYYEMKRLVTASLLA